MIPEMNDEWSPHWQDKRGLYDLDAFRDELQGEMEGSPPDAPGALRQAAQVRRRTRRRVAVSARRWIEDAR